METMSIGKSICEQMQQSLEIKTAILDNSELLSLIETVALKCIDTYKQGGKLLLAGNGGSAADAQHLAAELVSKFYMERAGLACIALTTNTSVLTAIGNDYDISRLFARQIEANGVKGDLFIGISTSGNSRNVIETLKSCLEMGITTVGLTGSEGGRMKDYCDYCLRVPSSDTPRIQESHILIGHILCSIIEEGLFGKGS